MTDVLIPQPNAMSPMSSNDVEANNNNNNNNMHTEEEEEEQEEDTFDIAGGGNNGGRPLFDLTMLVDGANSNSSSHPRPYTRGSSASVATTADIASDVGSVMMMPKEAFLKSFTFLKPKDNEEEINWGITFGNPVVTGKTFQKKTRLPIESVDDLSIFSLSRISQGDYLKTINGKSVGPSVNGPRALAKMKSALEQDGFLQVTTKNREEGTDDILVHATIVKPSEGMTLEQLGMKVWLWGFLCIKSIKRDSIFRSTALKETDNIISVNEILCEKLTAEQFADVIRRLPKEITITVLRRKQRATGKFG